MVIEDTVALCGKIFSKDPLSMVREDSMLLIDFADLGNNMMIFKSPWKDLLPFLSANDSYWFHEEYSKEPVLARRRRDHPKPLLHFRVTHRVKVVHGAFASLPLTHFDHEPLPIKPPCK